MSGAQKFPTEYIEFRLMREMGWTLEHVRSLPQKTYTLYVSLMLAEQNAGKMRAIQSQALHE